MKKTDWRTGRSPSRAPRLSVFAIVLVATVMGCGPKQASNADLDLVIRGGRVMDPESGLDAVRNVGVREGRIGTGKSEQFEQSTSTYHGVPP